ncbi:MAG TPA: hypothetical protein VHY19_03610 [Steroidobacteraceae bacterium]|jgi:hypothetical protein|nr:hypothetical protein [Steroidobacteraceae bacterium]
MKLRWTSWLTALLLASLGWSVDCSAQSAGSNATTSSPPPAPAAAPAATWQPDDRLIISADGATLTGTSGGGGGSVTYLHQPGPNSLLGVASEYQRLAGADWTFVSLNGSYGNALTANTRWIVHGDVHEGIGNSQAGVNNSQAFHYDIEAGGLGLSLPYGVSVDAEERQFDVDTTHGSLPKATLAKAWGRHVLTTVAYARSYGGNLDTQYEMARVDIYGPGFALLGGASFGRVTPAVVNIPGVLSPAAKHLSEPFVGVTKSLSRVDLTLLGDDLNLAGIRHLTVTLNCLVHLR